MSERSCIQCFQPLNGASVCPHCGFDQTTYQPEPHILPVGTILHGRYTVGMALGEGGFGITYAGFDSSLDRRVAIKEFFPGSAVWRDAKTSTVVSCNSSRIQREIFETEKQKSIGEAKSLAQLDDIDAVVRVLDFFEENNTAYIIMEFVEGVTLKNYAKQQPELLSVKQALSLLLPVLRAVETIHGRGFVHRDISPDNIMINKKEEAKLLDFGAVKTVTDAEGSATEHPVVKRGFSPIELYTTTGRIGPWSDVYSTCATIYYLVTGKIPDEPVVRMNNDHDLSKYLSDKVNLQMKSVLMKGLALSPEQRYQNMGELIADLISAVNSQKEPKPEPVPKKSKTKPVLIGFLLFAVLATAAVFYLLHSRQTNNSTETTKEASEAVYRAGDSIQMGRYPQTRVTDTALLTSLDSLPKTWTSYEYYSGTGKEFDGKMAAGDYMRYADVSLNGDTYRAVTFDTYRPHYTGLTTTTATDHSWQDNNGYSVKKTYYFKFEPLIWRVLDPATGLVLCENIIDSQPYQNTLLLIGEDYWLSKTKSAYANNYEKSSIRLWLLNVFYHTAFSSEEKALIGNSQLDNSAFATSSAKYNCDSTSDPVFLLSYKEALTTAYGFSASQKTADSARQAQATDYAKCQGISVSDQATSSGCSLWWLRSPGFSSIVATRVDFDGAAGCSGYVCTTGRGVRPAFRFANGIANSSNSN